MDKKLTFNSDAESYDKYRSNYCDALFAELIDYVKLDDSMKVLEIGMGTGQATKPILDIGCHVTAIEIGDKLANLSREKFSNYDNFEVINCDFESVELEENSYDLIYSASAFHWISLDSGINKVKKLLKRDGVFAWISTTPIPSKENEHIFRNIQRIYANYPSYFNKISEDICIDDLISSTNEKLKNRADVFRKYSFNEVRSMLYEGERIFSSKDYALMTSTFSDHKVMKYKDRIRFQSELEEIIKKLGDKYKLNDRFLLCMGRV